ncbi:efflux RND transporter periplasmic adaptor subunit [bacterium]|nr:efflux RND transporter periplasmic adaptor subunit [bacterium]
MKFFITFFILLGVFVACSNTTQTTAAQHDKQEIDHYTCPMHAQIHKDEPGTCPICGMDLVPVYKDSKSLDSANTPDINSSLMIAPDRQQLIGVKTTTVKKMDTFKNIRTVGSVAFDPELAVAIREYLELKNNFPDLAKSSKNRLKILGLSDSDINNLSAKTVTSYTLPASTTLVYATLFESDFPLVKPQTKAVVSLSANPQVSYEGVVTSIDNVVDSQTRQARARIQINTADVSLKPSANVNVDFKIPLGEQLIIPQTAVLDNGNQKTVFMVKDNINFYRHPIQTGDLAENNTVVVLEGLNEGDIVVDAAAFLIDSEAQLKGIGNSVHQH